MNEFTPSNNIDDQITESIETYGWHVVKVIEDEYGPSYAYTIGLYKSFQHPEIIIIGPEVDIAHFILNIVGEAILKGTRFQPESYYPSLVKDAFLFFTPVEKQHFTNYVDHAQHYYKDLSFPLLQCVYPSPNGSYPWQTDWPENLNDLQPYLGKTPVKEKIDSAYNFENSIKIPLPTFD